VTGHDPDWDDHANHGDHPAHDDRPGDPYPGHHGPDEEWPGPDDAVHIDSYQPEHSVAQDPHDIADAHGGPGHWHDAHHEQGSGIVSQEQVLADLTGTRHTEAELHEIATEHGWYIEGGGTPLYDIGSLLEYFGMSVQTRHDGRLEDIELALAGGIGVIVALSAQKISYTDLVLALDAYPGIPGQDPGRAVHVTGVDRSDPAHPAVIVNDPGPGGGAAQAVPLPDFLDAWAGSGNFTVLAGGLPDV